MGQHPVYNIVIHPFSFGSGTLMIKDFSSMLNPFYEIGARFIA